jgi:hypothetical protein
MLIENEVLQVIFEDLVDLVLEMFFSELEVVVLM